MFTTLRLLLAFCLAVYCSLGMTATAQEAASKISSSQLFTGELQRLEPHLGLTGHGCVKVAFDGEKELGAEVQVWTKGKSTTSLSGSQSPVKAGEVSISVREAVNSEGKMMYKVIIAAPGGTRTGWVEIPAGMRATGSATLPGERIIKDGTPVAVWALIGSTSGSLSFNSAETVEQAAKRADWALVLSITLTKKK